MTLLAWLFPGGSSLTWPDGVVLGGLFAAMGAAAWVSSPRLRRAEDFFLAGRKLSWPRACLSLAASEISVLALLGLSASTYAGDWSVLQFFFAAACARLALVWLYLPFVYPAGRLTVYGYLGDRFGPDTRTAAAGLFLGMKIIASGARLAAGAAVIGAMLGVHPGPIVVVLALVCAFYTGRGGLWAVSGAALVQTAVIFGAVLVDLFFISRHWPGGLAAAAQAAHDAGRFGLGAPRTAIGLAPAFFVALATFGADQELAQNALAADSLSNSRRAMGWAVVASLIIGLLYMALGTALFAFYRLNPGFSPSASADLVYAHFCLTSLPAGLRGLGVAALAMAAVHLPLCSMSAVFIEDFYRPWLKPRKKEAHYLATGRSAAWFFAAALSALAVLWNSSEPWLAFVLKLGGVLLGPLLGVFLFALFSRRWADRANVVAVACAAGVGAVVLALIEAGRFSFDPNWLVVSGALLTAVLARQLSPYLDPDQ
jgi:Na+/proline symporter